MCQYQNNPCEVKDCNRDPKQCGLYSFLKAVDDDKECRSLYPKEKDLIEDLRECYVNTWNDRKDSRAKGKATGTAFEKWIKKHIDQKKGGKVCFSFGKFAVDVAIPSRSNASVILEIKIYTDTQHTLALGGLLNCSPKERKLGLVTFYDPGKSKRSPIGEILSAFKSTYKNRFDYFIIQGEGSWSNTLQRLNDFCST